MIRAYIIYYIDMDVYQKNSLLSKNGKTFRKNQLSVDLSLAYERNKAAAKTLRIHLETSKKILEKMFLKDIETCI